MVFLILVSISFSSSTSVSDQADWQIDSNVIKLTITLFLPFQEYIFKAIKRKQRLLKQQGEKDEYNLNPMQTNTAQKPDVKKEFWSTFSII